MGRKKKEEIDDINRCSNVTKSPNKRFGGYHRWGNSGPLEERGQISAPASLLNEFREKFPEKVRRQAITLALKWILGHSSKVKPPKDVKFVKVKKTSRKGKANA